MTDEDRVALPSLVVGGMHPSPSPVPRHDGGSLPRGEACTAVDFVGSGFLDAYALATATGLRLSVSVWQTNVGPWGRVLDQRPEPRQRIRRGGRIAVTVSGRPYEQVPDVRGLPLGDAIERLVWLGFVPLVDARRSSRTVSVGHVLATRPGAGALLTCGAVVALTVARAPRAKADQANADAHYAR